MIYNLANNHWVYIRLNADVDKKVGNIFVYDSLTSSFVSGKMDTTELSTELS